jgi:hypothetical protein
MKKVLLFLFIINLSYLSAQDVLDIAVKGISDAQNDGAQKDRLEAILDAKRQACEKAGLKINAKTTVENFQTVYDFVETQADAVLLPGFQIVDVGYMADGTYQVVLTGKVKFVEEEKISIKELRYAKSLNDRGKYSECEQILKKYIDSDDESVSEQLKENSFYYYIKWGYSFNTGEDVQKFASYYPDSKYVKKLEHFAGFSKNALYNYNKTIEPGSSDWIDTDFNYKNVQYNESINALRDTITFNDFKGDKYTLLVHYTLYNTDSDEDEGNSAYQLNIYYSKGENRDLDIQNMNSIEERFKSFSHTGSKTFNHSASGIWFDKFRIKNYQITGRVPTGDEKYTQTIKFSVYQKAF